MTDLRDIVKNGAVATTMAFAASFANAAAPAPAAGGSRLEQAAIGGPAGKIAREYYAKPMNDASLEEAKKKLLELPQSQIRQAATTFHELRMAENQTAHTIGDMMVSSIPGENPQQKDAAIKQKISEIQSPELHKGLSDLYERVHADMQNGKGLEAVEEKNKGLKTLGDAATTRQEAFKTVVDEASKEKMASDFKAGRESQNFNKPS
jgi:hypothetical protein